MTEIEAVRWRLSWLPGPVRDQYILHGLDARSFVVWHELVEVQHIRRSPTLPDAVQALVTAADIMLERHA